MDTATQGRFSVLEIGDAVAASVTDKPAESVQGFSTARQGDFGNLLTSRNATQQNGVWHNALGLESTERHRHVSRIWQERGCRLFSSFLAGVEAAQLTKTDRTCAEKVVRLGANLTMLDGTPLTAHALKQVAKLGEVPHGTTEFFLARAEQYAIKAAHAEAAAKAAQDEGRYDEARTLARRTEGLRLKAEAARADLARHINDGLDERETDWASRTRKDGSTREARSFLVRYREQDGQQIARAILSERYGIIDNHDALRLVAECFPRESWENGDLLASHAEDDGDNVRLNLLVADYLKDDPDSRRGVGIVIRNSEVGGGSFGVLPFLFDAICLNGTIWGRRNSTIKVDQRHIGRVDLAELQEKVAVAVRHALSEGRDLLTAVRQARYIPLTVNQVRDERADLIIALSRQHGLSREKARAWALGYNEMVALEHAENRGFNPLNVGTLVDGLTRGAQQFNGEDRLEMETAAGAILAPKLGASEQSLNEFWQRHRERAAHEVTAALEQQYQLVTLTC